MTLRVNTHNLLLVGAIVGIGLGVVAVVTSVPPLLILGAGFALSYLILFLRAPIYGLLVLLLLRSSTDLSSIVLGTVAGPAGIPFGAVPNIGLVLVLVLAGGILILARGLPTIGIPGSPLFVLLLLSGLVGTFRSESPLISISEWLPVLGSFVIYILAAGALRGLKEIQRVLDIIAVSFLIPALVGFHQLFTRQGVLVEGLGFPRIRGTFVHPNPFGFFLVLMVGVFLSEALLHRGRRRFLSLAGLCSALVLLGGTFTRIAWLGAVTVIAVIGALRSRGIVILLPVVLGLVAALIPAVTERLSDPLGGSFADRYFRLWPGTLKEWMASTTDATPFLTGVNRLLGLGPGAGLFLAQRGYGRVSPPHNDYLRLLVEYGLIGLVVFIGLLTVLIVFSYMSWMQSRKANERAATISLVFLSLTLAFSIMSLTDNVFGYTANQVYFWTIGGLAVAAQRSASSRNERTSGT